jgi:hypothetical protein
VRLLREEEELPLRSVPVPTIVRLLQVMRLGAVPVPVREEEEQQQCGSG